MRSAPTSRNSTLKPVDPTGRDLARDLTTKSKDLKQGVVTELAFRRRQKAPIVYNEMKFASNAKVRLAQELGGLHHRRAQGQN